MVTVTGGHNSRVSLAALIAVKSGQRPRLVFRVHQAQRGDKRKGFTEAGYARLLDAAHQLPAPRRAHPGQPQHPRQQGNEVFSATFS